MRRAVKCESLTSFKRLSHAFSSKRFLVGAEEVDTHLPEGTIGKASQNLIAPVGGVNAAVKPSSASKTINISLCSLISTLLDCSSLVTFAFYVRTLLAYVAQPLTKKKHTKRPLLGMNLTRQRKRQLQLNSLLLLLLLTYSLLLNF
jgi:hypothetical protein